MTLTVLNQTKGSLPRAFIKRWTLRVAKRLRLTSNSSLTIVFLGRAQSRKLNRDFRGKDRPTDVLSFEPFGTRKGSKKSQDLGELAVCLPLVKLQAKEHGLSFNEELGYLILHGILHLLGYEHEKGGAAAKRMFRLQDSLFEDLCRLESSVIVQKK